MQTNKNIQIAVIPFIRGNEPASVVTDGKQIRAYRNGWQQSFSSLWWAVETLSGMGFHLDKENMKPFAEDSFKVVAEPHGWNLKHSGVHWYGIINGNAKVFGETKYSCQIAAVEVQLTQIF